MLGVLLLPGVFMPPLFVFGLLWILNGADQVLIAIPSSTLLAEHTVLEERGRACAAHFALSHACWLITYPAVGYAAAKWGAPVTFTVAGIVCLLITAVAKVFGQGVPRAHTHTDAM
jgi:NRE family putative nickel resistance protein-like MFS transporter